MVVDVKSLKECSNTYVYISDAWGHGLIVYNMLKQKSWRIEHKLMKPDKSFRNNIHDGIFTVSLSPKKNKLQGNGKKYNKIIIIIINFIFFRTLFIFSCLK